MRFGLEIVHGDSVNILALVLGFAALGLFIAAVSNIVKGRLGSAVVFGIIALLIGGAAGGIQAYA